MFVLKTSTKRLAMLAGVVVLPLVASGCVGSSTYGTGKTPGTHLLDGLGGIAGSSGKKAQINYASRPDLVKPSQGAALPLPVEDGASTTSQDFPEDPEITRARIRAGAPKADERSGAIPLEAMTKTKDSSTPKPKAEKYTRDGTIEYDYDPKYNRERFLKQKAELAGVNGAAPRKYLTEPPRDYRTPHDTAPIGEVGIDESVKAKERNGKKSFSLSDLNPFS